MNDDTKSEPCCDCAFMVKYHLEHLKKAESSLEKLTKALAVAESALKYMTEDYDCDAEDVAAFDKRRAEEALAQIEKIKKGE